MHGYIAPEYILYYMDLSRERISNIPTITRSYTYIYTFIYRKPINTYNTAYILINTSIDMIKINRSKPSKEYYNYI